MQHFILRMNTVKMTVYCWRLCCQLFTVNNRNTEIYRMSGLQTSTVKLLYI